MPVRLPLLPPPAAALSGKTYGDVDHARIASLAAHVTRELAPFFTGALMTLVGFMPEPQRGRTPEGHLEVWFQGDRGLRALLVVQFDCSKPPQGADLAGWTLETARDAASGADSSAHTLTFRSFDEMWRFVCLLGQSLAVSQIRLGAGA